MLHSHTYESFHAHSSSAEVGMPGDLYLLLDETSGAYSSDVGGFAQAFCAAREISGMVFPFSFGRTDCGFLGNQLRECGLGYRAPNLLKSAQLIAAKQSSRPDWGASD